MKMFLPKRETVHAVESFIFLALITRTFSSLSIDKLAENSLSQKEIPSVLSFESASELRYFTFPQTSRVMLSNKHYKDGFHSLLWRWEPGDQLKLSLRHRVSGRNSGVKLWLYRNESALTNLTVMLLDQGHVVLRFNFSLYYSGWRAAWVGVRESKGDRDRGYDEFIIAAPTAKIESRVLFMDLLCFAEKITFQSRDQIIPPINGSIYTIKETWQQTYRWSLKEPPKVNSTEPLTSKEMALLSEIHLIDKRLVNWFADQNVPVSRYRGNVLQRWKHMVFDGFRKARKYLKILNITVSNEGIITGSPLFLKRSQFGHYITEEGRNKKLGNVSFAVLFPLALDYYFCSQSTNVQDLISTELANINSLIRREFAVKRITRSDFEYSKFFLSELRKFERPLTPASLRTCVEKLNMKKLDTILLLLRYIADQGWTEGSAMGSLDHALNNVGNGYMNSMFLLRDGLAAQGRLDEILRAMKWFNYIGEIYQENFEYSGTTADKLRTIIIYRLQTILMNPERNILEKREKIRDMTAYMKWCNNVLLSHPALLAMFKPDGSCFHHLCVYGSAYCPEAMIKSSTVYYLLAGTSFSLDDNSRMNLRRGLLSYIRMAPTYSLPNSISGRFPNYSKAIIVEMLPAYAFLGITPRNISQSGKLSKVLPGNDTELLKVFARLYKPHDLRVLIYLQNAFYVRVSYSSSIGSLQILESLNCQLKKAKILAAKPPSGHWVHNFAALSYHRRHHWVVSVKGFSQHVWNFESSGFENVYGLYQSNGALQISNDEESLAAYDVSHGWDWTRIPGTTTMKLSLEKIKSTGFSRYYQPSSFVGGVVLISGRPSFANGIFVMNYHQPQYEELEECSTIDDVTDSVGRSPNENVFTRQKIGFSFKKSVFFYHSLIICLGSDISANNSEPYITQTTLFQNKYISETSAVFIDGKMIFLNQNVSETVKGASSILDTNGNGYYIPDGMMVNVTISEQYSRTDDGRSTSRSRYATTWFDHGINPTSLSYEYAILVDTDVGTMEAFVDAQTSHSPFYEVIVKNSAVHMVRFMDSKGITSEKSPQTYGYTFFNSNVWLSQGPIINVTAQCLIMAEIDAYNYSLINLSISSPDRNYNSTLKPRSSTDNGLNEYFYMVSQSVRISVKISRSVILDGVLVDGKPIPKSHYPRYIVIQPDDPQHPTLGGSLLVFGHLINGESVEVSLTVVGKCVKA